MKMMMTWKASWLWPKPLSMDWRGSERDSRCVASGGLRVFSKLSQIAPFLPCCDQTSRTTETLKFWKSSQTSDLLCASRRWFRQSWIKGVQFLGSFDGLKLKSNSFSIASIEIRRHLVFEQLSMKLLSSCSMLEGDTRRRGERGWKSRHELLKG